MKAICIIASDNVVIDGDVVFNKRGETEFESAFQVLPGLKNITIMNSWVVENYHRKIGFKLSALWFWHMVILRKSHVYLVGVNK